MFRSLILKPRRRLMLAFVGVLCVANCPSSSSFAAAAPEVLREHGVCVHRGAFTSEECDKIVEQFSKLDAQRDVRVQESVSRTNYFDLEGKTGSKYDWIYQRILDCAAKEAGTSAVQWGFHIAGSSGGDSGGASVSKPEDFKKQDLVDFILMHQFEAGDFFDWHTDTSPKDGTARTVNINIMLSDASSDYRGGGLHVGDHEVHARKGDLYWYPASFPHKVGDIHKGKRHTLIVAIKAPSPQAREATDYWKRTERNFAWLASGGQGAEGTPVSKWHFLHGEYLLAAGRDDDADKAFALAYRATPEADQYATQFDEDGQRLVAAGKLKESLPYFLMATRIDPTNQLYLSHLQSIEAALAPKIDESMLPKNPPPSLF